MRICDRWMQEGTADRRFRSLPPQFTISRAERQIVRMAVTDISVTSRTVAQHIQSVTHHPVSASTIRRLLQQSGLSARRPLLRLLLTQNHRRLHRQWCDERRIHTGSAMGIMVWDGIGYHSRTPLVRIAGTLNSQRYISEVLEPIILPYLQGLPTAIFQQDNAQPHMARIVQRFLFNRQIELLPWPARSLKLSPIENMWSMVAQRLTQITSPAATPDQLWQRVEATWSTVPQEHIQMGPLRLSLTSGNVWKLWPCLIIDGQAEYSWWENYAVYLVGPARSGILWAATTERKDHRGGLLKTIDAFELSIARKTAAIRNRHDKFILQRDDRSHAATPVKTYLETLKWEVLPNPPYNPDIAPSDYYLFRSMQHGLADQHFSNYDEVNGSMNE
ncbi:TMEM62 [Cordylochernes scorpioides]|uniref:TMEM62 n=1 Tax=Cordylochernes scorpioides TaxID=51811 RepID=A0ABY6L6X8_9ARAC|nr:TMEM62 [Cordylochernes scorpioides]